ncbi:beta-1,4-mannosyltransferase [Halteromyces radiatus]|uniref:beta-1,4-mannosyltransferase n=1 Tax=Halteromyces radiatus TaxID=101107 RepID=UPI00221FFDE0|nr:beta-1,4-mannosyltransferase [Halteromyces radiatus]KAI8093757.1 beta-1,4-mannosyltransferase [Halteromyces radiatus]
MLGLELSGNFSVSGLLLAILCFYLIGGRLIRIYLFENTGRSVMRPRPVVQVVVVGDIGRSPRMRYHAVSLADSGCTVDLIGYVETPVGSRISAHRYIRVRPLKQAWSVPKGLPKPLYLIWAPFKALFLSIQLWWLMGCVTQFPDFIFVQNPPSIPTLAVARLVSFLRQAWLIIDWHNFGYSILGVTLGMNHPVVRWAKRYEKFFGNKAYAHLTVTTRLRKELEEWNVQGKMITFRDRPQSHFKRLSLPEVHEFLQNCHIEDVVKKQTLDADKFLGYDNNAVTTLLTRKETNDTVIYRSDRPRLIVSSTSWTEDEDFSLLLKAVEHYEQEAPIEAPRLLFVITGKGPLKDHYEKMISRMQLKRTRIITMWLEAYQYPLLLGSADLGISLHTSSSGMDLPMKVVDMFGCGLPVCAVNFECLDELVVNNKNGLVFDTDDQLAAQLLDLFVTHPERLETLRANVLSEYASLTWENQWKDILMELFPAA